MRKIRWSGEGRYTIRKCMNEMNGLGTNKVYLRNGTLIVLTELGMRPEEGPFSRIKKSGVVRKICCRICPGKKTNSLEDIKRYNLYSEEEFKRYGMSYFGPEDYLIPEREMNAFIFANGGIDHLSSISTPACIIADMMED